MQRRFWILPISLALLATLSFTGCETSKGPRAMEKGKVTFNKQPVRSGTVTFFAADGRHGSGQINDDGSYEVGDAPIGEATITVTVPDRPMGPGAMVMPTTPAGMKMPPEMDPGKGAGPSGKVTPIPDKYKKLESSPLKYTVQRGDQEKDIELIP